MAIRIECYGSYRVYCDAQVDSDTTTLADLAADGWTQIEQIRTLEASMNPDTDPLSWQTHMGVCPACSKRIAAEPDG